MAAAADEYALAYWPLGVGMIFSHAHFSNQNQEFASKTSTVLGWAQAHGNANYRLQFLNQQTKADKLMRPAVRFGYSKMGDAAPVIKQNTFSLSLLLLAIIFFEKT
jgi:hypothetical protein